VAVAALSTKNPYYIQRETDWIMMRDAYGGERYVKDKGEQYLPPTGSQRQDGMGFNQPGWQAYQAYRTRAVYHELVKPSLMAMLGVMHRKPPDVELPAKLDGMRNRATFNGEGLPWLLQKVNEQQMLMGRYGLFLDVASGDVAKAGQLPYIIGYNAETIINWDSSKQGDDKGLRNLELVVLNETDFERRSGLSWIQMMRYRVLALAGSVRDAWPDIAAADGDYVAAEVRHTQDVSSNEFVKPSLFGKTLGSIPFVFVGPRDLSPEPDLPVLMPLARIALAIYRTEADYRQALYMQGQDTLVVIGQQATSDGAQRVGAFGTIEVPVNGDAKYIGADSKGLSEMSGSIQNDLKRAAQLGAQLLTERGNEAESGDALNIRVASRTATLTTVAQAGAGGLEQILRHAAVWVGADPDQVHVNPNMDFADDPAQAQDLVYLMTAKGLGLKISDRSIHGWMAKREFTEMSYEEEQAAMDDEPKLVPPSGVRGVRGVPGAPGSAPSIPKKKVPPAKAGGTSGDAPPAAGGDPSMTT
jgi:hypothetical protein